MLKKKTRAYNPPRTTSTLIHARAHIHPHDQNLQSRPNIEFKLALSSARGESDESDGNIPAVMFISISTWSGVSLSAPLGSIWTHGCDDYGDDDENEDGEEDRDGAGAYQGMPNWA